MTEALTLFAIAFWPVLGAAALLFWWAKGTSVTWLRWVLGLHTGICFLALLIIHSALVWAITNCSGSAFYGFQQCPVVSGSTANYAFPIFIFGNIIVAALTIVVVMIGGITEWRRARSR